jgi:hypothetical protein
MKTMRFLLLSGFAILITAHLTVAQSQDTEPGNKADPDVKWNVTKKYDEHGNLIYYDSSSVHTWNHFDFPGPEGWNVFEDLDSLFPDGFMPFEESFDRHKEWIGKFREGFTFPGDSLNQIHPKWQQLPQQQKKPARRIEI